MRDAYTWTLVGGDLALDLCNTRSWRGDPDRNIVRLCSLTEYDSWREAVAQVHGTELPAVTNKAELARIHLLRDTVLQVLDARAGDREASGDATRRLALTGTPFRSDDSAIPFVTYEPDGQGHQRSKADHSYGYADALADGVVRPVVFLAYSGQASWRTSARAIVTE